MLQSKPRPDKQFAKRKSLLIPFRGPVAPLLKLLKRVEPMPVIGQQAMAYQLGADNASLTDAVKSWRNAWPNVVALPHPGRATISG